MQEHSNKVQKIKSFIKTLIKAAAEEIKSVSAGAFVMVLSCAVITVLGLNLISYKVANDELQQQNKNLSDKHSQEVSNFEDSLEIIQQEVETKDDIIQKQQETIKNNETEKDQLADTLKEQIENLDLTKSASSRSDSEVNSIKNSIAETELLIRDYFGYSAKADELIDLLHNRVDAFQDVIDRYPDFYPAEGLVGSPFGYRKDPIEETTRFHSGIDIGKRAGAPIFAAGKGEVTFVGFEEGYGLYIIVNHGEGFETKYAHINESFVQVGDVVEKGQHIAVMGTTGRVTGAHLHFEVILNGEFQDPADYIL